MMVIFPDDEKNVCFYAAKIALGDLVFFDKIARELGISDHGLACIRSKLNQYLNECTPYWNRAHDNAPVEMDTADGKIKFLTEMVRQHETKIFELERQLGIVPKDHD
jgi:hypothetical protein